MTGFVIVLNLVSTAFWQSPESRKVSQGWCLDRRNWERELVKPGISWAFPVLPGHKFGARSRNGQPESKPEGTKCEKGRFEKAHRELLIQVLRNQFL